MEGTCLDLYSALDALVKKLDLVLPACDNAFVFMAIHGMPYDGPTIEQELKDAKEALRKADLTNLDQAS